MKLVVQPKTKKEEKAIEAFLEDNSIDYLKVEEEAAVYGRKPQAKPTSKKKDILQNLDESVEFVKKYRAGKVKTKSLNQLLNEL